MPAILLFILYFLILSAVVRFLMKRICPDLSPQLVFGLFSMKVAMGCLYGYIFLTYYGGDDTWMFYRDSLTEYHKLTGHTADFFLDFSPAAYFQDAPGFLHGLHAYLKDLESLVMVKTLAIFDIFSLGNYYTDVLFFEFLVVWGPILLYKMLYPEFPEKKWPLRIILFFVPTLVFWLSGIRAEGLILLFLSAALFFTRSWFRKMHPGYLFLVLLSLAGYLVFRGQSLLLFLPAFFCWTLSIQKPERALTYFSWVYLICFTVFLISLVTPWNNRLAGPVIQRQAEFLSLHGNTRLPLEKLDPSIQSFVRVFPQAFGNSFLRPFFWEARGALQELAAAERLGCWLLVGLLLLFPDRPPGRFFRHPMMLAFLFYGLSQILLTGYIVPFPGALIRYTSIPLLMVVLCLGLAINWKKIDKSFKLK
jgi:hypothetical protein